MESWILATLHFTKEKRTRFEVWSAIASGIQLLGTRRSAIGEFKIQRRDV